MKSPAVFLDRDGVVIKNVPNMCNMKKLKIFASTAKAVKMLKESGFLVIIVTNQPQIAKGFCTERTVRRINKKIIDDLAKKGAVIDWVYYCPHHPEKGFPGEIARYKIICSCRKPKIGMLEKAKKRFGIDMSRSFIVGDSTTDIRTGKNAAGRYPGFRSVLVKTGLAGKDGVFEAKPDFSVGNVLNAAELIRSLSDREERRVIRVIKSKVN
jgi:histidinol-phosphate phosphatase family protein